MLGHPLLEGEGAERGAVAGDRRGVLDCYRNAVEDAELLAPCDRLGGRRCHVSRLVLPHVGEAVEVGLDSGGPVERRGADGLHR